MDSAKYLVGPTSGPAPGREAAPYYIVEIKRQDALEILAWMRKFDAGGALFGAGATQLHNSHARFTSVNCLTAEDPYDAEDANDSERVSRADLAYDSILLSRDELACDPDTLEVESKGGYVVHVEYDHLNISGEYAWWSAITGDYTIETDFVLRKDIEIIAEGGM